MSIYADFLKKDMWALLQTLQADAQPHWGTMHAQEMVEHLRMPFMASDGTAPVSLLVDEERAKRSYDYIFIQKKPMARNIKGVIPPATKPDYADLAEAIEGLHARAEAFFAYFAANPTATPVHPVFGKLNFDEWTFFHYTHIRHHFIQFGLVPDDTNA